MRLNQRPQELYHCVAAALGHKADLTKESAVKPDETEGWPVEQKLNIPQVCQTQEAHRKTRLPSLLIHLSWVGQWRAPHGLTKDHLPKAQQGRSHPQCGAACSSTQCTLCKTLQEL